MISPSPHDFLTPVCAFFSSACAFSTPALPGSGSSRSLKILSLAAIPFIAMWKNEPSCLIGRKKSAASRMIKRQPARSTSPALNRLTASIIPSAAPPYAIKSIIVMELSCMVSTFMVILRNLSDSSFIFSCLYSSALYTLSVVSPCRFSRNVSPRAVYCPQYFDKSFFAHVCTSAIDTGISGTQISSTTADSKFTLTSTTKSVSGASMA